MLSCEMPFGLVTAIDNRNVRLNVSCQEPSQKLSTSIGLICCQILRVNSELINMLNSLWALNFGDFTCLESDTCGLHGMRVFGQTVRLLNPKIRHVYQRVPQPLPCDP
jgi:hypothetical protein